MLPEQPLHVHTLVGSKGGKLAATLSIPLPSARPRTRQTKLETRDASNAATNPTVLADGC